ncbi:unnamed protein product [Orchesella dallaii]|uniref:Uncharacterized protein n=1 Tax=Orchesella dallaii TaxID=48710 RepID=A0ABP1QQ06_9HEXA
MMISECYSTKKSFQVWWLREQMVKKTYRRLVNMTAIPRRFFSKQAESGESNGQRKQHWSTLAVGLFGLGASAVIFSTADKDLVDASLITTAHCAIGDDCEEKKCDQSDCLRKQDREEELIAKANSELEKALRDTKPKAVEFTEAALTAYCDAIESIKLFMNKTYCAIEEESLESPRFEDVWCDVLDAAKKRCEAAKTAMEKGQCAWELLRRLREIIDNGKACKYTSCNPLLVTSEETMLCAEKELCGKKATMDLLLKESRVVEQYRNMVEEFRRDLKAEADSLIPSEDCKVTLTENEANMVFLHAYKKILRIQKEMNKEGKQC